MGSCDVARSSVREERATLPNIVLIVVDDLGWKDLGCMGSTYYETPKLDAFARQGMRFTNAYAGAANCAPSRACLLSGQNTPRHGVYTVGSSMRGNTLTRRLIPTENTKFLSEDVYTLPKMMGSAGYVTGSFGKWHVGLDPLDQGIDVNVGGSSRGNPGRNGYFSPYNIDFITDGPKGEYLTDRLTTEALSFVERYADTSFFLYLPYYTVHTPIMGKEELVTKFKDKPGSGGQNRPDYAAMVASMDENIGRILDGLDRFGLDDNTLVIITSDNGGLRDVTNQAPLRAGKGTYYEGGIRVPLLIRWPGRIEAGSTINYRVSNLDLYPTLQSIVSPPRKAEALDGLNLLPLLTGKIPEERTLYFHFPVYLEAGGVTEGLRDPVFRTRPGTVVIDQDWKLHHYFEDDAYELYYLPEDPGESHNLADLRPVVRDRLISLMNDWRAANGAPIPTKENPDFDPDYFRNE